MRYSLRTLLLLTLLGPPLLAAALIYGDRPYREFRRWVYYRWFYNPQPGIQVIRVKQPQQQWPDEGNPNPQ